MTFPGVAAVNGGNNASNSANHTVNLPSGISAGNLLLVLFSADSNPTISFPAGWTEIFQTANGSDCKFGAWYKIADGGEGASITATTSASEMSAHTSYRLTSTNVFRIQAGTPATGSDANPDSPSFSPIYGTKDYVWFAVCGNDRNRTISGYPANYSNGRNDYADNPNGCGVGSAYRELNADIENPGTFTIDSADEWVANTIIVSNAEIDVGQSNVSDRPTSLSTRIYTMVEGSNPANDTGSIDTVDVYFTSADATNDFYFGTFSASGNVLTCRDSEQVGDSEAGAQQFTGLDIDVESGDYIGAHDKQTNQSYIDRDTSGYTQVWWISGEYIDPSDSTTFSVLSGDTLSLYGTGETVAAGWTNIAKVNGVTATDLAKVDGIAVADIAKINGAAV